MIAEKVIALFDDGEFDVCTLFFSRFRSVIAQIPTALQIIPPVFDAAATDALGGAAYEFEPDAEDILQRPAAAQHRRADVPCAAGELRVVLRRADVGHGQRHPQRRRHDPPADAHL